MRQNGQYYNVAKDHKSKNKYFKKYMELSVLQIRNLNIKNFEQDLNSKKPSVLTFEIFLFLPSAVES